MESWPSWPMEWPMDFPWISLPPFKFQNSIFFIKKQEQLGTIIKNLIAKSKIKNFENLD